MTRKSEWKSGQIGWCHTTAEEIVIDNGYLSNLSVQVNDTIYGAIYIGDHCSLVHTIHVQVYRTVFLDNNRYPITNLKSIKNIIIGAN